ncbi:MAG: molybdate ABC transporter, partial [Helicobacter sp.]|nr:molybdate ABC transporter [Helicobacter sp.]
SLSLQNYLHKDICIGFKESNVVVASRIDGVSNTFEANILSFENDNLFMRLLLECKAAENDYIKVLTSYECGSNLARNQKVFWHILESEIMILGR